MRSSPTTALANDGWTLLFDDAEPDPLGEAARDNGLVDARRGARIGHRRRVAARRAAQHVPAAIDLGEPRAPRAILALLAVVTIVTLQEFSRFGISPTVIELKYGGGLSMFAIARGEWSAVLTANLLHGGLMHLLLNLFVIGLMGRWVEHLLGTVATLAVIFWSALGSSIGALLLEPAAVTIGASGIAFGLVGAAVAADPRANTATGVVARSLIIVNVIGTFIIPGISIGGHLGGLAAGALISLIVFRRTPTDGHPAGAPKPLVATATLTLAVVLALGLACWETVAPVSAQARGLEVAQWLDQ